MKRNISQRVKPALLGVLSCAFVALVAVFAVPRTAHAAVYNFTGPAEVDATWGKASITYVSNYGVNESTLNYIGKYNLLIDLDNEGKPVSLNGHLGGYTYTGVDYTGASVNFANGQNARRGRYDYTLRWPSASTGIGWRGSFVIAARGKGALSLSKTSLTPAEAQNISQYLQLKTNSNTNVADQVTYTYTGTKSNGGAYSSSSAPTEPGRYTVKATLPADASLYLTGYTTAGVEFIVTAPGTGGGSGGNTGGNTGGNPGANLDKNGKSIAMYYTDDSAYDGRWTNQNLKLVFKSKSLDASKSYNLVRNGVVLTDVSKKPTKDEYGIYTLTYEITQETDPSKKTYGDVYMVDGMGGEYQRFAKIDKTVPKIASVKHSKSNGSLKVRVSDVLSGLNTSSEKNVKSVSLDNGATWKSVSEVKLTDPGSYSVTVRAQDNAGNEAEYKTTITVSATIDPSNPDPDDIENSGDGFAMQSEDR